MKILILKKLNNSFFLLMDFFKNRIQEKTLLFYGTLAMCVSRVLIYFPSLSQCQVVRKKKSNKKFKIHDICRINMCVIYYSTMNTDGMITIEC